MSDIPLRGKIIGFEEYDNFVLHDAFGEASPFRLLSCSDNKISFVVVNPYHIAQDYSFEIDDTVVLKSLLGGGGGADDVAVLCIVRPNEKGLFANLRSPLIVNMRDGYFIQTILQNETYGVSVPFIIDPGAEV